VRVAVYSDFPYRRDAEGLSCGEAFVLFACRLTAFAERVVLVGRLDPEPGRFAYPIPPEVGFLALPHYSSLARPAGALRAVVRSVLRFDRLLRDVDAVFLLGPHPLAIVVALLARRRGRRVVLGVRQDLPRYMRHRAPRRADLRMAAVVLDAAWRGLARRIPTVAVGDDLARRYRGGIAADRIVVTLVDDEDIVALDGAPARDWDGERRLLSVGRLDPEKNPLLLADVLAALDDDWRLVVCGEGSLAGALAERLAECGVAGRAELRGYVPYDRGLRELYRTSHALLHVSRTEGVPQVLYEAFAAGLPVVGTAVGGVAAAAGSAALLVAPDDAAAAARAVRRLDDASLRRRMVAAGRRRALAHTAGRECMRLAALLEGDDRYD
jgi:glycosyltransferase involved in cell wall biosynthesis